MTLLHLPERSKSMQDVIHYKEIFDSNKKAHFRNLKERSGVAFEDMIFFDNEYRCVLV